MKNWREIKKAIEQALSGIEHEVKYVSPTKERCSYFEIGIKEDDFSMDQTLNILSGVVKQYQLAEDIQGSYATLDLNAYWDIVK